MPKPSSKKSAMPAVKIVKQSVKGITGKLLAVEPEYRFGLYLQLQAKKRKKKTGRGSPMLSGSFENGKRK